MANDVAVGFGGASGYLEMKVYKPPNRSLRRRQRSFAESRGAEIGFVDEAEFDCVVDPKRMVTTYVATEG